MPLSDLTVEDFSRVLASDAPAPGGGSAAALEGALGASLLAMVCRLTGDKPQHCQNREQVLAILEQAEELRLAFLKEMERDTQAFDQVRAAFAMPKRTEEEKTRRSEAIQTGMSLCLEPPLAVMELALRGLSLSVDLAGRFNENTASDLGVAMLSLRAGMEGAWLNVRINAGSLRDRAAARTALEQGQRCLQQGVSLAEEGQHVLDQILA